VVDSLKALDPNRPIREADINHFSKRHSSLSSFYTAAPDMLARRFLV
jgi:hypothetical protein